MGTPVKVPPAASSYTAATQDPDLRSQVNMTLLHSGSAAKIQEQLLHSLHAHPSNWPSTVQAHALSLLRSGEVTTFPALLRRVLDDIRQETFSSPSSSSGSSSSASSSSSKSDGAATTAPAATTNGETNGATTNGLVVSTGPGAPMPKKTNGVDATPSLAVPAPVIEEALKITQDCLDQICEIDDGGR